MELTEIRYIKERISKLPQGNITYKTINNKRYPYYQWTENGKQRSRIVKKEEFDELSEKIEQRKVLMQKLKEHSVMETMPEVLQDDFFFSVVKRGKELTDYVLPVKKLKKRECYGKLEEYIYGDSTDRIFILYGLRRTGKTTLIRQMISEMDEDMLNRTAFVQITSNINLAEINADMRQLEKQGYHYVFIDEATLMDDFIESAAVFPDIYASSGMKIVLSGTDSLGFIFSEDRELYDRCFLLHTTFVPYREFENVLGIKGIDQYIRFGGTMSMGGINYNKSGMTFANRKSTDEYVDSAIARNIQHSLKNYSYGDHFRNLRELYEANELTSAINRIVEDINHRFTLEILTKEFASSDLALSAKNLLKDRNEKSSILYEVDKQEITEKLRQILEIKNLPEQTVEISAFHSAEVKEYLDMLDLTVDINTVNMVGLTKEKKTAVTQPGLRFSQAEALIKTLMEDEIFRTLSLKERNAVTRRILSDVEGRMMEEIVLIETQIAHPECEVFKLLFARGEFDMVVFNPETENCAIYEIKHSTERVKEQYRHLVDEEKCIETEFRFGTITGKYVIYRGASGQMDGVQYVNIEEYLVNI